MYFVRSKTRLEKIVIESFPKNCSKIYLPHLRSLKDLSAAPTNVFVIDHKLLLCCIHSSKEFKIDVNVKMAVIYF